MRQQLRNTQRRGAVLVEFALIALVLFVFLAAVLDFGRAIHSSQIVQQAAETMARELSQTPLPASYTFETALNDPGVRQKIYNDSLLVVSLPAGTDIYAYAQQNNWPLINQMLVPLMIIDPGTNTAYYPGVWTPQNGGLKDPTTGRYAVPVSLEGGTANLVPVVEQISPNPSDPNAGPFSLTPDQPSSGNPTPAGYVALRINFPFQAAGTVAFTQSGSGDPPQNTPVAGPAANQSDLGSYGGGDGLGSMIAMSTGNGGTVRPFRRLVSGQAIFRREVFTAN